MKKNEITILLITLLLNISLLGQTLNLNKWKIDTLNTKNINKANHSRNNWIFEINNDTVSITKNKFKLKRGDSLPFSDEFIRKKFKNNIRKKRLVKKVKNGYLIGVNNGEFGGGLYFISNSGKKSYTISSYLNVRKIFEYNSKIYISSGLAHLGGNYGRISELKIQKRKWTFVNTIKLIGQPSIVLIHNRVVYVITSQYVLKLNKDMTNYETILKAPVYWGVLYPSSAFISKNNLFISMRKGIMKIENFEISPIYKWYVPKNDDNKTIFDEFKIKSR